MEEKKRGIVIEKPFFDYCWKCKFWSAPKADYNNPEYFVQQKCNKPTDGKCPTIVIKQKGK